MPCISAACKNGSLWQFIAGRLKPHDFLLLPIEGRSRKPSDEQHHLSVTQLEQDIPYDPFQTQQSAKLQLLCSRCMSCISSCCHPPNTVTERIHCPFPWQPTIRDTFALKRGLTCSIGFIQFIDFIDLQHTVPLLTSTCACISLPPGWFTSWQLRAHLLPMSVAWPPNIRKIMIPMIRSNDHWLACQQAAHCMPPDQTLLRLYIWWRSFWASSRVERSMAATWHASRAYAGGPRGSHEYISALLPGRLCTFTTGQPYHASTLNKLNRSGLSDMHA